VKTQREGTCMKLYTASADLCTPEEVTLDRVRVYLRAYRSQTSTRWGGEMIPEENREPVSWPEGEVILRLPSGGVHRATSSVVSAGTPVARVPSGRRRPARVRFHQMARLEGIGPPPPECL
jgi:hypothetical protein